MEDDERSHASKVRNLLETATNSTGAEVDPRLLKAIKSVVRYSDSELQLAADTLMELMKRDHAQVRYLTLLIIDELFMRSKLFRTHLVGNLDQLLTLSVGFRRDVPLPGPPSVASVLRKKAIELLEKWKDSFGIHYRHLRLGYDYLNDTLRYQFPNIQANAVRLQQERKEREKRSKEIWLNKYEHLKADFSAIKGEIKSTMDEIGECLDILRCKSELVPLHLLDNEESEEFRSSELRQIRRDALAEAEKIHEDTENKVVFDTLRELYKFLVTKHLLSIQEWISVLVRAEIEDSRSRDSMLKEFIDIRNCLQSVKKHCEEAGCTLPNNVKHDEEDQDFWEVGKVEISKNQRTETERKNKDVASTSTSRGTSALNNVNNKKYTGRDSLASKGKESSSNSVRRKLLAEAPVVDWGSYLDNWGSGSRRVILANQRGLELESHWGRVDYDAVVPSEKVAELNLQAMPYKEDPVEIQPCRAPLRKGRLCTRRDLKVCPFHGPKVPRDDEGKPLDPCPSDAKNLSSSSSDQTMDIDVTSGLVEKLAKQAVKNVRERDREIANSKEVDKRAMKLARRVKIREHNEAVLREAALASTSRSAGLGYGTEGSDRENLSTRNSKQSLASMLRRKVTAKDRIRRKLSNTRATDATTRQLASAEEASYREAFPNQW